MRCGTNVFSFLPAVPEVRVSTMGTEATVAGGLRLGTDMTWRRVLAKGP